MLSAINRELKVGKGGPSPTSQSPNRLFINTGPDGISNSSMPKAELPAKGLDSSKNEISPIKARPAPG